VKQSEPSSAIVSNSAIGKNAAAAADQNASKAWLLLLLPLGYLWFRLIDNLHLEWLTNPQYSYSLFVPFLVAGLLMRRWQQAGVERHPTVAKNPWIIIWLCALLVFLYLPTRLVEVATPEWRPIQWLLGIQVIGLSLYGTYLAGGKKWFQQAAFPLLFFLVAIPWPTLIESPIIQGLSRANAAMVVDVLGIFDVPAVQHGNVIEVSTGMVGINDACSGIRSFQSSLMISLFLGEFYRFSWPKRLLLVFISFTTALLLNVCRTSLLTWIAAKKGTGAIDQYHDEAGWTILMICTGLLWAAGWLLNQRRTLPPSPVSIIANITDEGTRKIRSRLMRFALALIIWLVITECSVEAWYWAREADFKPGPNWTVTYPTNNPTYKDIPLTEADHTLLRFDEGKKGQWQLSDGSRWQAFYFNWLPGRVAGYLAKRHTPDICITAEGYKMTSGPDLTIMNVHGIELPMRHYIFASSDGPLQIYQCHWEAGQAAENYTADESSRFNLIRGVWAGRGNHGQKVLEIVITGYDNSDESSKALAGQLDNLVTVEN